MSNGAGVESGGNDINWSSRVMGRRNFLFYKNNGDPIHPLFLSLSPKVTLT